MPDAFDLLGIEPRFTIDTSVLDRRHRDLLAQLHPDRNRGLDCVPDLKLAPDRKHDAREALLAQLGDINDAYRIILDPICRAEQLLGRRGIVPTSQAEQSS